MAKLEHKCDTCKRKALRFTKDGKRKIDNCAVYHPSEWLENRRVIVFDCRGYERKDND